MSRRRRDHERIDNVLAWRVAAEDYEPTTTGGATLLDRLLTPLNRMIQNGFCARHVRRSGTTPSISRTRGSQEYAVRLAELELLSAAKIADLLQPGQVLLRLAVAGFGVRLPPPDFETTRST